MKNNLQFETQKQRFINRVSVTGIALLSVITLTILFAKLTGSFELIS